MEVSEELIREHDLILAVLDAAEKEAGRIGKDGAVDAARIRQFVEFFRNFVDRCHHGKEEKHLFFRISMHGLPEGESSVAVMFHEHEQGRKLIAAISEALPPAEAGDADAARSLGRHLQNYVELLRIHIDKENNVLFPRAENLLSDTEKQEVVAGYEKIESAEMGEGTHEQYHEMAHALSDRSRE